ncbi:MAG: CocE/NonD family hydrolase [Acidobacteriota bacterium]
MPEDPVHVQLDVSIPMRDGVRLYAALYRPAGGAPPFPTLLIRSPYSTQHPRYVDWALRFARGGYAVVLQDCRGRYESEGDWTPYSDDIPDGEDTLGWLSRQGWCNGQVGTFGISYPGFTQVLMAASPQPCLKALVPIANQEDNYGHLRYNGLLQLQNAMNFVWVGRRTNQNAPRDLIDWPAVYRRLPLLTALDDIADRPFYREVVRHSLFDEFWSDCSMKRRYADVQAPALFISGWYDNLLHEIFKCFRGWTTQARSQHARSLTRLLVGPWVHSQIGGPVPGELSFGPESQMDMAGLHLRWYDYHLRQIENGVGTEAPVRIFVMGDNQWRDETEWPLARTEYRKYYLRSFGNASSVLSEGALTTDPPGSQPPDSFVYDPENPVPTLGGQGLLLDTAGPRDRSPIQQRPDVLVYSTPPLEQDLEVTGPVGLRLFASSSAPDTDFTATLTDVTPTGQAIALSEGIVRARFRESYTHPSLIVPGRVYTYDLPLWETSNVFKEGHRIRLEISSSNFPRFDRNLNTGLDPGTTHQYQAAKQTIRHDTAYPSHLILPVIPR